MLATASCSVRHAEEVAIVDVAGTIVLGDPTNLLRDTIRELVEHGHTRILLNLDKVEFIDSSGIATLVNALTYVRDHRGDVKLLNLRHNIHDLLQLTRLNTVFQIFDEERAAVSSFGRR